MLGRLELIVANGKRFAVNQLLFADYGALVADSEEKFCWLVIEFWYVEKNEIENVFW